MPERKLRSAAAARQARYRKRQRRGQAVHQVVASDRLLMALIVSQRLTEGEALNRMRVDRELSEILEEWARVWV